METTENEILKAPVLHIPTDNEDRLLIEQVAEDIHPGCWDLNRIVEPNLFRTLTGCHCSSCQENNHTKCSHFSNYYRLIITIPEATIRNSHDETREIKEFHIALILSSDLKNMKCMQTFSMRTDVGTDEYACGVFHPHSTSVSNNANLTEYFKWRNMCLGGETELTDLMYTLTNEGINRKDLFELLVLLYTYTGWESLEGGPYRNIGQWTYPCARFSRNNLDREALTPLFDLMIEKFYNEEGLELPEIIISTDGTEVTGVTNVYNSIERVATSIIVEHVRSNCPDMQDTWLHYFNALIDCRTTNTPLNKRSGYEPILPPSHYRDVLPIYLDVFNKQQEYSPVITKKGKPVLFKMRYIKEGLELDEFNLDTLVYAKLNETAVYRLTHMYKENITKFINIII